jgi:hypothetical protein
MIKHSLISAAVAASLFLTGCQTTSTTDVAKAEPISNFAPVVATPLDFGGENITLKQAMAHPDWLGRQPERAFWAGDSQTIIYSRKQAGNELRDTFAVTAGKASTQVVLNQLHTVGAKNAIYSNDGAIQAYTFEGNVFVKNIKTGAIKQLTQNSERASALQFLNSGDLAYRTGNSFFSVDINTGLTKELVKLHLADEPKGTQEPSTYIAKEQHKLIDFVKLTHKNALDKEQRKKELNAQNETIASN